MTQPYDIVIVGGGIAGLACALSAPAGTRIAVVDKGEARAGSSPLAQGGIAAAVGPEDSVELHATDTIAAGAGICGESMVRDICGEGPDVVAWLGSLGARFDRGSDGELDLAREGGQTVARSVHTADATGFEIVRALREAGRGRAERIDSRSTALLLADGRCTGVMTEDGPVLGRGVLLATGGAGALWA
ncbi:MAG: FAD-dependent oxidoreductase, partial [Actinomycetota bacterium]